MKTMKFIKKNKMLFLVGLVYAVLFILSPEKAVQSGSNSLYYLIELLEVLPLIFLATVLIEAWIPKEVIMNRFGEKSGFMGNLLSLVLGSLSAGPIYAAFPIGKMLLAKGASITNIVIILSTWAVIKVPMLANEVKFLGVEFMTVRWLLTVTSIFLMAYLTAMIVKKKDLPGQEQQKNTRQPEIRLDYCVSCGVCVKMAPEVFEMADNAVNVKMMPEYHGFMAVIRQSVQKCPTHAIAFDEPEGL